MWFLGRCGCQTRDGSLQKLRYGCEAALTTIALETCDTARESGTMYMTLLLQVAHALFHGSVVETLVADLKATMPEGLPTKDLCRIVDDAAKDAAYEVAERWKDVGVASGNRDDASPEATAAWQRLTRQVLQTLDMWEVYTGLLPRSAVAGKQPLLSGLAAFLDALKGFEDGDDMRATTMRELRQRLVVPVLVEAAVAEQDRNDAVPFADAGSATASVTSPGGDDDDDDAVVGEEDQKEEGPVITTTMETLLMEALETLSEEQATDKAAVDADALPEGWGEAHHEMARQFKTPDQVAAMVHAAHEMWAMRHIKPAPAPITIKTCNMLAVRTLQDVFNDCVRYMLIPLHDAWEGTNNTGLHTAVTRAVQCLMEAHRTYGDMGPSELNAMVLRVTWPNSQALWKSLIWPRYCEYASPWGRKSVESPAVRESASP